MKSIAQKLANILKRGGFAFENYPVSILFAVCLAILSIWMIHAEPMTNLKLLYSLQWSFAFGALAGMASCVIAKKYEPKPIFFIAANIAAFILAAGAFFALFFTAGLIMPEQAIARIVAAMGICFLVFLFVPTFRSKKIHYNEMVFMTLKSFFIAAVYSLVIMLGCFFVAFAVESLLYQDMTEKVYPTIAILSGLIGYAFFLGYFPEFTKEEDEADERLEKAIRQPKFAEILFQKIMIPIFAALTLVLFIWAVKILITMEWPEYTQTIAIFTTYSMVGIFLYFLVTSYDNKIVRLYKRIIPIATLVFLAFEAYPIIDRIRLYGMKPGVYAIVFLWLLAAVTDVLFMILPIKQNRVPSYVAIALIAVIVLPVVGAYDLSFSLQSKRLEAILSRNGMLSDGKIVAGSDVSKKDKTDITDATEYLFNQENRQAPEWVRGSLPNIYDFAAVYGFEPAYYYNNGETPGNETKYLYLQPDYTPVLIEDYVYYISRTALESNESVRLDTDASEYTVEYDFKSVEAKEGTATPKLMIKKDGAEILSTTLEDYGKGLIAKYPVTASITRMVPSEELTLEITGGGVQVKMVFQAVNITADPEANHTFYFELSGIYFKETK